MKTIYLVRHGEAEVNLGTHYRGENSPLTKLGKEQARFMAKRAEQLPIDVLVSSTMMRARETAEIISELIEEPIVFSDFFCERKMPSELEGRLRTEDKANRLYDEWARSFTVSGLRIADGENFQDVYKRAGKALTFLEERPEENILVVTHGFFSRILITHMLFGALLTPEIFEPFEWGMRTKNTGLSVLKYDPADKHRPWWLLVWNDHAHLG